MVQKLINLAALNKMGHIIQEYLDSLISIAKPIKSLPNYQSSNLTDLLILTIKQFLNYEHIKKIVSFIIEMKL